MTDVDLGSLEPLTDDELEAQREFLLRSLDDLEAERLAGDVDDRDYETLRDGYTARAAAVLRLLDARRTPGTEAEPAPAARRARRPSRWRTAAIVASVAAFAVAAGFAVAGASGRRLPGNSATGTVPNSKVAQELALAVQDFGKGDVIGAIRAYDTVLATDPANAEALAYRGWLLRLAGAQARDAQLIDQGLASILAAERAAPSFADPHFFAGEIELRDKHDPRAAITEFQTYLGDNPPADMGPEVRGELQAAQAELAAGGVPPASSAP